MRKALILLLGLLPMFALAHTPEIVGAEISYAYLGNSTYEVKLNIYTRCNQELMNEVYITVSSPDSNFKPKTILADLKDMGELPSDCHSDHHHTTTCDDPNSERIGYRKWTATAEFTLYNMLTCEYLFSWQSCCRTNLITTGSAEEPFYIDAYMNICGNPNNSSAEFTSDYHPYLPVGHCAEKEYTSMAPVGSGTFRYELVPPKSSQVKNSTFSNPYSFKEPLSHSSGFGHPEIYNPDYGCSGFLLNNQTGDLEVRAVKENEVFPVSVSLNRYGGSKVVSRVTRDLMYWTNLVGENHAPIIAGIDCQERDSLTLEPFQSDCFTICSFDPDVDDSVSLFAVMEMSDGKFTVETDKKWPKAQFCWRPVLSHKREDPYKLIITAKDNFVCADMYGLHDSGTGEKTFLIYVRDEHGHWGINEEAKSHTLKIYPQPGTELVYAETSAADLRKIELFDMTGRTIKPVYTFTGNKLEMNISELSSGTYMLRVYSEKNLYSGKIVIAR